MLFCAGDVSELANSLQSIIWKFWDDGFRAKVAQLMLASTLANHSNEFRVAVEITQVEASFRFSALHDVVTGWETSFARIFAVAQQRPLQEDCAIVALSEEVTGAGSIQVQRVVIVENIRLFVIGMNLASPVYALRLGINSIAIVYALASLSASSHLACHEFVHLSRTRLCAWRSHLFLLLHLLCSCSMYCLSRDIIYFYPCVDGFGSL